MYFYTKIQYSNTLCLFVLVNGIKLPVYHIKLHLALSDMKKHLQLYKYNITSCQLMQYMALNNGASHVKQLFSVNQYLKLCRATLSKFADVGLVLFCRFVDSLRLLWISFSFFCRFAPWTFGFFFFVGFVSTSDFTYDLFES